MAMSKADYEMIASVIALSNGDYSLDPIAINLANAMQARVPTRAFRRSLFLKACGCSPLTLLAQQER